MLFYGDEAGYTNDYSYLDDTAKNYDNRWMHRPVINWEKNKNVDKEGTIECKIFSSTQKLITIRNKLKAIGDYKNLTWLIPHNIHVAGYLRTFENQKLYCLFNFSAKAAYLTWHAFKEHGAAPSVLYDHWQGKGYTVGNDHDYLVIEPYQFLLFEVQQQ